MPSTRLELNWIGKDTRAKIEPRVLLEDRQLSYHRNERISDADIFDNILIYGDNLLALKALESEYTGKIKCVYIDPPYNTGSAFEHYDDGLEHSTWLSLMRDRLELIWRLLAPAGVLFVSIDDSEFAYLAVLLDEIFGRRNSCGQLIWEKKKKPSFLNASMGGVTEYILAYAKDRTLAPPFVGGVTTAGKKYPLNNAGNSVKAIEFPAGKVRFRCADQVFDPQDMSEGNIITRLLDRLEVRNGVNVENFRLEGEWRYSQSKLNEIIEAGESIVISKAPFRPNHIKEGGEPKKMKNLLSIAHYGMSTYEDATEESRQLFGKDAFDYPKPEKLVATLIGAVTEPGDIVLDSFAGSGTTGAAAHKMGRRWIMIELGEHCHTHIIPRMKKVIDGVDKGGISEATEWNGGGGFRYFRLAPSLLEKDSFGNWIINKQFNPCMLTEAICKIEGFRYAPSDSVYWQHGHATETSYIYVTTQTLSREQLVHLSEEVGDRRSLLVMCSAFRVKDTQGFENLSIKKIPKTVLSRCEWGKDDYSLEIRNLPMTNPETDTRSLGAPKLINRETRKAKARQSTPTLFD